MSMRHTRSIIYRFSAALFTLLLVLLNLRLYVPRGAAYGPEQVGPDVEAQLRFIRAALNDGADEQMQTLFPEGAFFTNVLYGLAWVEIGRRRPEGSAERAAALAEARWALARLDAPASRAPFAPELDPPFGVFYIGWSNWLRGGALLLEPKDRRDPTDLARFQDECATLAAAFDRSPTPFLPAYPGQAWPVDSVVGIATLRLHDQLLEPRYGSMITRWLEEARALIDPATGLLPHRVDPENGAVLQGTRGSSQSIIARFLVEIDPVWGREQYALFREQFVAAPFSLPGVREYPAGALGGSDVDSGPLVAGLSASATVVTLGAAQVHGDQALAGDLLNAIEFVGSTFSLGTAVGLDGSKRYVFGLLPVGDAFLAWSKTARLWLSQPVNGELPSVVPWWWRAPWHVLTLALLAVLWAPAVRRKLREQLGKSDD